jgi:soluble lytic murein transglycosylase-like protein
MINRTGKLILVLLLLAVGVKAQARLESESSLEQRAVKIEPYIAASAQRYGIDPRLLRVVCYIESRYRLNAVSPKGARGPMQFMPETAARYALTNPHDARSAIDAGARYLRDLLRRFDGRIDLALAAYNAGEGTVNAFLTGHSLQLNSGKVINPTKRITDGIPPYRETQNYVRSAIAFLKDGSSLRTSLFGPIITKSKVNDSLRDFTIDVNVTDEPLTQAKLMFIEIK